jgi:thiosulfate sulfurtransferase
VTIADVRDPGTFLAGKNENAVNVQQENVEEFLSTTDKTRPLVVYCYHGHSSQGAADHFFSQGCTQVYSVDGGYEAWRLKF